MKFILILLLLCSSAFANERGVNIPPVSYGASGASGGPWMIDSKSYITIQSASIGVVTGTFQVQVSNDPQVGSKYPMNWANLAGASISVATSTGGVQITAPVLIDYSWAQVVWTPVTVTGSAVFSVQMSGF